MYFHLKIFKIMKEMVWFYASEPLLNAVKASVI